MKFLALIFLAIFLYLISATLSYSIEKPNIKNIVLNKSPKGYNNVVFKDINDVEINIDSLKNKLIILNFWATWCAPCIKEIPYYEELNKNPVIDVLLVSLDFLYQY